MAISCFSFPVFAVFNVAAFAVVTATKANASKIKPFHLLHPLSDFVLSTPSMMSPFTVFFEFTAAHSYTPTSAPCDTACRHCQSDKRVVARRPQSIALTGIIITRVALVGKCNVLSCCRYRCRRVSTGGKG
jgi:hypothetical protein